MRQYIYIVTISFLAVLLNISTSFAQHLDFDGTNDKVTIPHSGTGILGDFSVSHDFTIEMRFTFTGNDINTTLKKKILSKQGSELGFFFETTHSGYINVGYGVFNGATWLSVTDLSTPVALNTPYQITMVYETSPLYWKVYLNGTMIADYPLDAWGYGAYTLSQSTYNTTIGDSEYYTGENGLIAVDYLRVWNKSRTTAEIQADMDKEVACNSTGLIAQYKFDDAPANGSNTGTTTVSNCVGGGYDGTLNNFAMTGSASNFVNNSDLFVAALPVELTHFEATNVERQVNLNWQTASEKNNEGFEVERSLDGVNWEMLEFVSGNGTTQEVQNYNYRDINPFSGDNYYRLKQIDFDGMFEYSEIVYVATTEEAKAKLKLYPTMVDNEVTVENGQGNVVIYNSVGQPVKQLNINDDIERLNVNDLPRGNYIIQVEQNGKVNIERFIKM